MFGPPSHSEVLRSEKRKLSAAISEKLAEAKRLRRADTRAENAAKRAWNLDLFPDVRRVALIIHTLADYKVEPAVVYLRGAAGKRKWPKRDAAWIGALVDACFMEVDLWGLAALTHVDEPTDVGAMREAVACVEQWRAVIWRRGQTAEKQVAPYSAAVILQYERARAELPADIRPSVWLGSVGEKKRASRWRKRWGGRFGTLRPRGIISLEELREKAQTCSRTVLGIWAGLLAHIWVRLCGWGRVAGPLKSGRTLLESGLDFRPGKWAGSWAQNSAPIMVIY